MFRSDEKKSSGKKSKESISSLVSESDGDVATPEVTVGSSGETVNNSDGIQSRQPEQSLENAEVSSSKASARSMQKKPKPPTIEEEQLIEDFYMDELGQVLDLKRPALFWWSEYKPNQRVIGTIMGIGFIYEFIARMKQLHHYLLSSPFFKTFYKPFWESLHGAFLTAKSVWKVCYATYHSLIEKYFPTSIEMYLVNWERFFRYAFHRLDRWFAKKLQFLIWHYPRIQETPVELIDDCIHKVRDDLCKCAHPETDVPRFLEIETSRASKADRVAEASRRHR